MMQRRPIRRRPRVGRNAWSLILIIVLLGLAVWVLTPIGSDVLDRDREDLGLRLGLDLKGGTHIVYQAEFVEGTTPEEKSLQMDAAINSISKRVDTYGVVEPIVQKQGEDRIIIQLPGITDPEQAKELIEQTAFLEFRELELIGTTPATLKDYLDETPANFFRGDVPGNRAFYLESTPGTFEPDPIVFIERSEEDGLHRLYFVDTNGNPVDPATLEEEVDPAMVKCWMPAVGVIDDEIKPLTGAYLSRAAVHYDESQVGRIEIVVNTEWDSEGAVILDQIAGRLYGTDHSRMAMILDDVLLSAPNINARSFGGTAQISGAFTADEARLLAIQLTSGALPMSLHKPPLYERTISATLGEDFAQRAFLAALIGLGVVALFILLYYRLPGLVAVAALLIYTALVLAIYKSIPVTLTLAGVAGFIVSLGMAVDANVLIFERLKEELRAGRTLKAGIETGFSRAWPAIRDSNITTFIACGILYWFGSSIVASAAVMGFAVTLFIGVAVSMFSAIVITRTFLLVSTNWRFTRKPRLFGVEEKSVQPGS